MITRRTRIQLVIFVIITLLGVSYVGARYADLDRYVRDTTFPVTAHFGESGGIFTSAAVTYRGVRVGRVTDLELTKSGLDVSMKIDSKWKDKIPSDTLAVVANKSAVGEQYVDLQPKVDDGPYLEAGSDIPLLDTRTPIATEKLLGDLATTVGSVNRKALRTTVLELGDAFGGTGDDLQRIIDTGNSFLKTADANYDTTTKLIEDGNTVLQTQVDSESSLRTFANQLSLFSDTLAGADPDLRGVIDDGSFTANQIRGLIEDNRDELGELLNNLVTTGEIVRAHLPGLEQILVIYPYVVEGSFTVIDKTPSTGLYDAHFGLILSTSSPCKQGYDQNQRRAPQERSDLPMDEDARCTEPPSVSDARGSQNAPKRAPADYRSPVVATFDQDSKKVKVVDDLESTLSGGGTVEQGRGTGAADAGDTREESWTWLYGAPGATS